MKVMTTNHFLRFFEFLDNAIVDFVWNKIGIIRLYGFILILSFTVIILSIASKVHEIIKYFG